MLYSEMVFIFRFSIPSKVKNESKHGKKKKEVVYSYWDHAEYLKYNFLKTSKPFLLLKVIL